ncbi:MAG: ureidoglycolate lyase [Phyllobacterium sp.]
MLDLKANPLTREAFAPFGEVIETDGAEIRLINNGTTQRFHALARADVTGPDAHVLMNIFRGQPFAAPIDITMMERHPLGSQAFIPLQNRPYIVIVADDEDGKPGKPVAFQAEGHQGVNYGRNIWHHPLLSLGDVSDFLVVDRGGTGNNLEEYFFADTVYRIANLPL